MRTLLPLLLIMLILGTGFYLFNHQKTTLPIPIEQGNVCDSDTMTCSDGTVLKRVGPKCEFPPCPVSTITITGTLICLPHKNASGPQTMECAYGLKGEDGNNYALSDPDWKHLMGIGTGETVEIKGKFSKKDDSKYDIQGSIEIESLGQR